MSWQLLIALSVLLYSVNGLLHRVLMKDENSDAYAQTIMFNVLSGLTAFVIVLSRGGLRTFFTFDQFVLFVPLVTLAAIATICAFQGIKRIEASEHTILLTSSKLWFIAGTLIFLKEPFSLQKVAGGLIILIGVVISQWRKGKFVLNAGAYYVLLAALLYASAEIFAFLILRNFDALSLIVYSSLSIVVVMLIIRPRTVKKLSFYRKPKHAANIVIVSINDSLATLFGFLAYQAGRNALQIGPLGATQTIVTVLLALIILRETDNMFQKILGAITVVIGTILLL